MTILNDPHLESLLDRLHEAQRGTDIRDPRAL